LEIIRALGKERALFLIKQRKGLVDVELQGIRLNLGKIGIGGPAQSQIPGEAPACCQAGFRVAVQLLEIAVWDFRAGVGPHGGQCRRDLQIAPLFRALEALDLHPLPHASIDVAVQRGV
jgi:hypothetical protein